MMQQRITSTGNMYAKQDLVITFATGLWFISKKVVYDDILKEEQENILAREKNKN